MKTRDEIDRKISEINNRKNFLYRELLKERRKFVFLRNRGREEAIFSQLGMLNNAIVWLMYACGDITNVDLDT